jgi:two-component system sensor histidine kinase KdpD
MTDQRPDPDELLEKLQLEDAKQKRGKLKIFFGACAGVGKTFAMLSAAQALARQGLDVLIGVIETHGRKDTEAQLNGLIQLPLKTVEYRGRTLTEFDLDAALKRKPALILMDELAHSNVDGSRHPKRWQDVEELLAAGIDVYSTLNVQHLESLNDVVGQITGVRVAETLPDKVFDLADEVTLVDLSPEELLRRLQDGKVYIPQQAEQARKNFFRKGNLIALREMALRRTADRVDAQMREYRADQSIQQVWQAHDRILVGVGSGPEAEQLVRVTARLAASLKADWLAVYVETPALQRLTDQERNAILKTMRLAQDLGAETATLSGTEISRVLLGYARSRNVSKLVVGKPTRSIFYRLISPSVTDQLTRDAVDVDIHIVVRQAQDKSRIKPDHAIRTAFGLTPEQVSRTKRRGYVWAITVSAASSIVAHLLLQSFELSNLIMLYLLGVVVISAKFGRGPGIFASILSVSAFDFFFVPPRFSFSISDTQYLLTFAVMFTVALVISQLTASLRYQAVVANYREKRSRALYDLGKQLASALTSSHIVEISMHHLSGIFQSRIAIVLPDSQDKLHDHAEVVHVSDDEALAEHIEKVDSGIAQWVYDNQEEAGLGTNTLPSSAPLYLPLKAPMRTRGVLAIEPASPAQIFLPEQRQLLDTFAAQIALALERVHYVEVARDALVNMESERLRNSLLSAISHDLRTPLTSILGISGILKAQSEQNPLVAVESQQSMISALHEQTFRMQQLVINLLDMARLQSGKIQLNRQWQMLEEIVGSALRIMRPTLEKHQVSTHLPEDLPLLQFDAVMLERVLCNLFDNACKYTPENSMITISARQKGQDVWVSVADNGPGLPAGLGEHIFDKFTRGEKESAKPGVGLGLSICQAIIQAHGGKIWAETQAPHGAIFIFSLPLGKPPAMPESEELSNALESPDV